MTKLSLLAPAALACALLLSSPARGADDAAHFQLNAAMMAKLKAAEADLRLLPKAGATAPEVDPGQSIEAAIAKLEQDKPTIAVLAKHGLSGRELVLSAHALLHAGTFVSQEGSMDAKQGNTLYLSYTREQRANIDLVRDMLRPK